MLSPLPVFAPGAFWCSTVTALILARMTRCSGARHSTATSLGTGLGRRRHTGRDVTGDAQDGDGQDGGSELMGPGVASSCEATYARWVRASLRHPLCEWHQRGCVRKFSRLPGTGSYGLCRPTSTARRRFPWPAHPGQRGAGWRPPAR